MSSPSPPSSPISTTAMISDEEINSKHDVVNFLADQKFVEAPNGTEVQAITNNLHLSMRLSLILWALQDRAYYVIKDHLSVTDCGTSPSGRVLDGHCYELHQAGPGWSPHGQPSPHITDPSAFSISANAKIVDAFKYATTLDHSRNTTNDMTLFTLYQNSRDCQLHQNQLGQTYWADVETPEIQTVHRLASADSVGSSCFVNLPVFEVEVSGDPLKSTPCILLSRYKQGGPLRAGYNYFPKAFNETFTDRFCRVECVGTGCQQESDCPTKGPTHGPRCNETILHLNG